MAAPKTNFLLRPYSHVPTPLQLEALPNYIEQELIKIETPLNTLAEHYAPNVTVSLSEPAGSVAVSTTPAIIDDYQKTIVSRYAGVLGLTVDPLAGSIIFSGDGTTIVTMEMSAFVTVTTIAQNNNINLIMTDGVTTWELGGVWIASSQQDIVSMGATITIQIPDNSVLQLGIYATAAGTVDYINGYFTAQFVSGIAPTPLP